MAAEYYARAFLDFKDLGLDEAANQVLKEGLMACPTDSELLALAKSSGMPLHDSFTKSTNVQESSDLGQLLAAMMKSQAPSAKVAANEAVQSSGIDCIDYKQCKDPEMQGSEFWKQLQSQDLRSILLQHGGLIRVSDFLPSHQAEKALSTLKALHKGKWVESNTSAYKEGEFVESAKHSFFRYDGDDLQGVVQEIRSMAAQYFPSFQAAMYENGGNLAAHDDSNYFVVDRTDKNQNERFPAGTLLFRKIAVIYYLTKDWQEDFGGSLMDMHGDGQQYFPRFNSMIAFLVPRVHQVQELAPGAPPRFSLFGWFSDEKPYPTAEELSQMPCFSTLES